MVLLVSDLCCVLHPLDKDKENLPRELIKKLVPVRCLVTLMHPLGPLELGSLEELLLPPTASSKGEARAFP